MLQAITAALYSSQQELVQLPKQQIASKDNLWSSAGLPEVLLMPYGTRRLARLGTGPLQHLLQELGASRP